MSMLPLSADRIDASAKAQSKLVLSVIVMAIVVAVAVFTFVKVDHELERSKTVESDNRTWVLAQIQVDVQNLKIALLQASMTPDPAALASVRLEYDVLYSRIELVRNAPTLRELSLHTSPAWAALAGQQGLLQRFLPIIDGPDAALVAAIPEMARQTSETFLPTREMIVAGLDESMRIGDASRQTLRSTLYSFLLSLIVTMVALTVLLTTIYRQSKAQHSYARMLELAVHNLRATIESARDAVLIINGKDQVIGANKAGETMLGRPLSAQAPMDLATILHPAETVDGQPENGDQMICLAPDGTKTPVEVAIAAATTATKDSFKIAFLRDMSQQLDRERQLAAAGEMARKGEEAKDRFLAVMSHEMRTPLSGLLSATDLMETTTTLDTQQSWLMGIVKSCGLAALEQVNNILELTRIAANNADDYPPTEFCMYETVRQQVQLYHALALDRGNTLTLTSENMSPCMVIAPLPLMRRILNNLLSNAIKFTNFGTIDVGLSEGPADRPGYRRFTLTVRDSGIGIAEADLDRIFHNFETLDSSYARVQEGTGLGLGIAKLSAEAMGGTISVQSRLGEGTCFTVTFEAKLMPQAAGQAETTEAQDPAHQPLQILLAEDNEINSVLLELQLRRLGHQTVIAADGMKAIVAAKQQRFDIILMDISMPHMDGVTATRHLHEQGIIGDTPVVALTAQASPDRVQELCAAGMADVVTKPVAIAKLDMLMQTLVKRQRSVVPPTEPAPPPASSLLDMERLEDLLSAIGPTVLHDMSKRFGIDMDTTLATFATALRSGNLVDLSKAAHKAAGAAGILTMDALCTALRDMETAAETETPDRLAERSARISHLHNQSLGALQQALKAA